MCDFHSVIVTGDGRILHLACNSHHRIASHFELGSAITEHWWECEWNGLGEMPVKLVQNRREGAADPTAKAIRAAERHYEKLAKIVAGDLDPMETAPFDGPEYGDVRAKYKEAVARKNVAPIVELIEQLDFQEEAIREIIEQLGLDIDEIAKERIEELENEKQALEQEKEEEFNRGVDAASEDMLSWDYHQELLEEEKEKWLEEFEDTKLAEVAYAEYCLGVVDAKQGAVLQVDYIQGMPSFLFE